jgi:hypothetical protein
MATESTEFIECGTVSISYDATGKASVSFSVISTNGRSIGNYNSLYFGGVSFSGNIMGAEAAPLRGSGGWKQWQMQWAGIGNR